MLKSAKARARIVDGKLQFSVLLMNRLNQTEPATHFVVLGDL
jgi:hypothetical protein